MLAPPPLAPGGSVNRDPTLPPRGQTPSEGRRLAAIGASAKALAAWSRSMPPPRADLLAPPTGSILPWIPASAALREEGSLPLPPLEGDAPFAGVGDGVPGVDGTCKWQLRGVISKMRLEFNALLMSPTDEPF